MMTVISRRAVVLFTFVVPIVGALAVLTPMVLGPSSADAKSAPQAGKRP